MEDSKALDLLLVPQSIGKLSVYSLQNSPDLIPTQGGIEAVDLPYK